MHALRTQQAGHQVQAKKRSLTGNQPCKHLDLELPASRTMRTWFLLYLSPLACGIPLWHPEWTTQAPERWNSGLSVLNCNLHLLFLLELATSWYICFIHLINFCALIILWVESLTKLETKLAYNLGDSEGPSPKEVGEHFQAALISTGRKGGREFHRE